MVHPRMLLLAVLAFMPILPGFVLAHEIKAGSLIIVHPWCRQMQMSPEIAAGFMKIINTGKEDDRLIGIESKIAPVIDLVDMVPAGNLKKMNRADSLDLPAGKTVALSSKSFHVMFHGLKSELVPGTEIEAVLVFEKAGRVDVDFEVDEPEKAEPQG